MDASFVGTSQIPAQPDSPVVVIDVLRAFTTAAWLLDARPSRLLLASTTEEALQLKSGLGEGAIALKDGAVDPGFDLGNSPGQVRDLGCRRIADHGVVQRTTNGTVAAHAARRAPLVLCAALSNAAATAAALRAYDASEVMYVITGDNGQAIEDRVCADLIHSIVSGSNPPADPAGVVRTSPAADELRAGIEAGYRGVHPDDVPLACQIDRFDFAMTITDQNGLIQLHRS